MFPKTVRCLECNKLMKVIDCILFPPYDDVSIHKQLRFCSEGCFEVYIRRALDDSHMKIETEKTDKDIDYKSLIEQEKQSSFDHGLEEGYLTGYLEAVRNSKVCPVCRENAIDSVHHIMPRSYNGNTTYENLIGLCRGCHDIVEIKTDIILKKNKNVSIKKLRYYILNGFPIEEKEEETRVGYRKRYNG